MVAKRDELIRELSSIVGNRVKTGLQLSEYTSFGLGGACSVFVTALSESELSDLLSLFYANGLEYFVLGNGTNILVSDRGYDGVVVKLDGAFKEYSFCADGIWVGAGCGLNMLIEKAAEAGFSGLEPLVGIPGTLGGALKMNASAYGKTIGSLVCRFVAVNSRGKVLIIEPPSDYWGYRRGVESSLVVSRVFLSLPKDEPNAIRERLKLYLEKRWKTQPVGERSAGCVFKNPSDNLSAASIIDKLGLKGMRIGGAYVSEKHANFIIAEEGASASDVYRLVKRIRSFVLDKAGVLLEPEIIFLGEFDEE